jgi:hypothetical protein
VKALPENYFVRSINANAGQSKIYLETWQNCFNFANSLSKLNNENVTFNYYLNFEVNNKTETRYYSSTGLVHYVWEFNDGILFENSQGSVTKFTSQFLSSPTVGRYNFLSNGATF